MSIIEYQIAEYMVNTGRVETLSGHYSFEYSEIAERFDIGEAVVEWHSAGILLAAHKYFGEMVADGDFDDTNKCFGLWFYTDYCPNFEE